MNKVIQHLRDLKTKLKKENLENTEYIRYYDEEDTEGIGCLAYKEAKKEIRMNLNFITQIEKSLKILKPNESKTVNRNENAEKFSDFCNECGYIDNEHKT
jgi:hypothetical protein